MSHFLILFQITEISDILKEMDMSLFDQKTYQVISKF